VDFKNKVILITGASSGIGKQTAIEFAKKGAKLILVARRKDKLELVAKELKKFHTTILVCQCDISDKDQVKEMSKIVLEKFNTIDILINNAGFAIYGTVSNLSIDEIESQMNTNYFGMIYCVKNFLPSMIENQVTLLMSHQLLQALDYQELHHTVHQNLQCLDFQRV